jgi:hypothetical protein
MSAGKALLVLVMAIEGVLFLRPDGVLVHAAQQGQRRYADEAGYWWKNSPVHMGCSVLSCTRPATHTATYRQVGARGAIWRAYGFCDIHDPPESLTGLVYRLGQPPRPGYDVPLTPFWAEIYFLLGIAAFVIWCACMWPYARSKTSSAVWWCLGLLHAAILFGFWKY